MVVPVYAYGTFTTRNATLFIQPAGYGCDGINTGRRARRKGSLIVRGLESSIEWPPSVTTLCLMALSRRRGVIRRKAHRTV